MSENAGNIGRTPVLWLLSLTLVIPFLSMRAQIRAPRTFLLNPNVISKVQSAIRQSDKTYKAALKQLRREADKALTQEPVSVIEKTQTPPSGDKHDYMSLAPYWWPDPNQPGGVPYIRRDGEVNPERNNYTDKKGLTTLTSCVHTLALAYYYTGDESYAAHATRFIRTWFLHPQTRMNPNLNYGQAVRGRNDGRGSGLIETSRFRFVIDAIGLLEDSKSWTERDGEEIRKWFTEYFAWLRTSKNGIDESTAKNNHGTWYDVQSVSIALFLGDTSTARLILHEVKTKRIAVQIEPDGRMPLELARTKALSYSTMNLEGFFCLASLAERMDIDLWRYSTDDGRNMKQALDWLFPFYSVAKDWTYKQIVPFDHEESYPLIVQAAIHFNERKYVEAGEDIPSADRTRILYHLK